MRLIEDLLPFAVTLSLGWQVATVLAGWLRKWRERFDEVGVVSDSAKLIAGPCW